MGTFNSSHVLSTYFADLMSSITTAHQYQMGPNNTPDAFKLALYNSTPDATIFPVDTYAHNAYLATGGQWVTANEVTGTNWSAGGISLASPTTASASSGTALTHWAVTNTSTASVTITSAFVGCLIYDSTLTVSTFHPAVCAVYFGGSYTVGGGTLAINWGNDSNASACVFYITV